MPDFSNILANAVCILSNDFHQMTQQMSKSDNHHILTHCFPIVAVADYLNCHFRTEKLA